MQANYALWEQTCDEITPVEPDSDESMFVEKIQRWLEGEDSPASLLAAYGLCGLTALYFLGCIIHSFWV